MQKMSKRLKKKVVILLLRKSRDISYNEFFA